MSFLSTGTVNYNSRITRAESLASRYVFAKEVLGFYLALARFQGDFCEKLPKLWGKQLGVRADGDLRAELNLPILVEPFRHFLSLVESQGPRPLAAEAHALSQGSDEAWAQLLEAFWKNGMILAPEREAGDPLSEFVARAFLLPYAEFLVSGMLPPVLPTVTCRCPRCNSLPLLGVLRP